MTDICTIITWLETPDGEELPVEAVATEYEPAVEPYTLGHPDNWQPGEPAVLAFEVRPLSPEVSTYSSSGLQAMLLPHDSERIHGELLAELKHQGY